MTNVNQFDLFKCTNPFDLLTNAYQINAFVTNVLENKCICLNQRCTIGGPKRIFLRP